MTGVDGGVSVGGAGVSVSGADVSVGPAGAGVPAVAVVPSGTGASPVPKITTSSGRFASLSRARNLTPSVDEVTRPKV